MAFFNNLIFDTQRFLVIVANLIRFKPIDRVEAEVTSIFFITFEIFEIVMIILNINEYDCSLFLCQFRCFIMLWYDNFDACLQLMKLLHYSIFIIINAIANLVQSRILIEFNKIRWFWFVFLCKFINFYLFLFNLMLDLIMNDDIILIWNPAKKGEVCKEGWKVRIRMGRLGKEISFYQNESICLKLFHRNRIF